MGRYDGPHFQTEKNIVSIWVAKRPLLEIPEDYFKENYDDDDDDSPFNAFSSDFGFGYYDHDFVESYCFDDQRGAELSEHLKLLSYSASFMDKAIKKARELKIEKTSFVFLIYNFKYDPKKTRISESNYFRFLGAFPFVVPDDDELE